MVDISREAPEQTETRLRAVIAMAQLTWHSGAFAYSEFPASAFPTHETGGALALVRDEEVWSVLKPATADAIEPMALFSFHFPEGVDNSGFVGWLASLLKRELGTGVLVVCGRNARRGGIFDYWGVPLALRNETRVVLDQLRNLG
jgi:hypothetical protein